MSVEPCQVSSSKYDYLFTLTLSDSRTPREATRERNEKDRDDLSEIIPSPINLSPEHYWTVIRGGTLDTISLIVLHSALGFTESTGV